MIIGGCKETAPATSVKRVDTGENDEKNKPIDLDSDETPDASETTLPLEFPTSVPANGMLAWGYSVGAVVGVGEPPTGRYSGDWADDPTSVITKPQEVVLPPELKNEKITQLATGDSHALALTESGAVWFWGGVSLTSVGNAFDLGRANRIYQVGFPSEATSDEKIVDIAAGKNHSLALSESGKIFTWGWGESGVLGDGIDYDVLSLWEVGTDPYDAAYARYEPLEISSELYLSGVKFTRIAAGDESSFAIDDQGRIFGWGIGYTGLLGQTSEMSPPELDADGDIRGTEHYANTPVLIDTSGAFDGEEIHHISAGARHVAVLTTSGRIFSWGTGSLGQLGDGATYDGGYGLRWQEPKGGAPHSTTPVRIKRTEDLAEARFQQVCTGADFTLGLTEDGQVFGWGSNSLGQLASEAAGPVFTPKQIPLGTVAATRIACGSQHAHAITADGKFWSWGWAGFGQLGDGTSYVEDPGALSVMIEEAFRASQSVPVTVGLPGSITGTDITLLAPGYFTTAIGVSEAN